MQYLLDSQPIMVITVWPKSRLNNELSKVVTLKVSLTLTQPRNTFLVLRGLPPFTLFHLGHHSHSYGLKHLPQVFVVGFHGVEHIVHTAAEHELAH